MLILFAYAFALGLLFNATPGAIFAETLRQGLKGGFTPALSVQIGSLVGDATWVVLGVAGAATLLSLPWVETPLALAGAVLLAWLGMESLRDARAILPMPAAFPTADDDTANHHSALRRGVLLSLSNPMNITYWAALGGTITALIGNRPATMHYTVFIGGFLLSSLLWCFIAATLVALVRTRLSTRLAALLHVLCGAGMLYLAAAIIYRLVH